MKQAFNRHEYITLLVLLKWLSFRHAPLFPQRRSVVIDFSSDAEGMQETRLETAAGCKITSAAGNVWQKPWGGQGEGEREGGGGEEKEEGGEKETNASISLIWPAQRLHLNFHLYIHVCFFYSSGFKSCKLKARHHLVQLRWPKENLWSQVKLIRC